MKFSDATIDPEQVDLEPGAAPPASWASWIVGRPAPAETPRGRADARCLLLGLLDEDGEDADDDREHAEAFGEGGAEDDLEAADLAGGVRVTPDRLRGETGQDADADAGADDPEGREACADRAHVR